MPERRRGWTDDEIAPLRRMAGKIPVRILPPNSAAARTVPAVFSRRATGRRGGIGDATELIQRRPRGRDVHAIGYWS
jgi:hypothetical protein